MKVFLDSSKISEIERWNAIIDGVTTNPTILLREGGDLYELAKFLEPRPISIEACEDFRTDALKYSREIANSVIKIPLLKVDGGNNIDLISELSRRGVRVNCTALMSFSQVILATKCKPKYVSLFAGRVDDEGGNYLGVIEDCMRFIENECVDTELIVGSIRSVGQVLDSARAGAHIVTIPPAILEKMVFHRFSLDTVRQFEDDAGRLKQ